MGDRDWESENFVGLKVVDMLMKTIKTLKIGLIADSQIISIQSLHFSGTRTISIHKSRLRRKVCEATHDFAFRNGFT